ncbi:serine/threonine protein phosphatase 1 [Pseudorhizobium tarimense]|uniref:Serine/threonine protein phosphatase 1 n=1 Tax=Pseudorhizobium tarimense TaxID=1079109 RepID=A0ABV2HC07_9HYPH|nr:metallophosphoesterase [Pseudorhizobium tarimense]MCJ8521139.1 metallophosphoesterase [Pseudorhizobium tarimense]
MRKFIKKLFGEAGTLEVRRRRLEFPGNSTRYPIYAIGDVHGCLDELKWAEEAIARDIRKNERPGLVVLLGDYVDRGPFSAQVLEHLCRPSELGLKRVPLCGNHDDLFAKFLEDPNQYWDWVMLGGEQTLMSYGIDIHHLALRQRRKRSKLKEVLDEAIPDSHRGFLRDLPVSLKIDSTLFVHAGIQPGITIDQQTDEDLMWIREPFLSKGPGLASLLVVHGHTARPLPDIGVNRIGIDTGAFTTGKLCVLKLDGERSEILPQLRPNKGW